MNEQYCIDKMETTNKRDPNKTTIITSSEMNQRTFRDEESWASLESTILGGNCVNHDETESSSFATDEIDSAKDKSKLATVNEESNCTDDSRGKDEFGKQGEEAEDEEVVADENNVLNMNIDAIDDEEVFFDCPIILSPRPYFLRPASFRPVSPRPSLSRTRPFLTIKTTSCNGTTLTISSSSLATSTGDSGLDEERTGAMIGQIVDDFNDMGKHAQSTPKIISDSSELGSSISSANNLTSEDKNDKGDCVVAGELVNLESTKKRLEYPMDDVSENDTTARRKKKIEVPAETYEFVKNLDFDDKRDQYDSNNNNIVTAKKRLERPSEIVRRMKVLCLEGGKVGQKKSELPDKADNSEKNVDLSEAKSRGKEKTEDLLIVKAVIERSFKVVNEKNSSRQNESNTNNKQLEKSESSKEKLITAKESDPASCDQPGGQKESNSMNESEANNINMKKLENSESANKEKPGAKKSDSRSREQPGNITRSIRPPKPINKFYKCRSPADKANKENYYAGKYSNVKKMISPFPSGMKQPTQRVAKMKEFFENRSRVGTNTTSKRPLIGQKRSPKGPSFHTTLGPKLRRSSPKPSPVSQASSLAASSYNPINDATTLLLTRNQSRFLRPSSCSEYSSIASSCADTFDRLSAAQKSKSMEDLNSESAQAAELRRFAMSRHVTKRGAYLKVTQCSMLLKRTPKKQPSPQQQQLLAVNSPKKSKSKIMNRKSLGFVSSPVKPVMELRKIFSPCTATNANTVKKHAGKTSKTLPHIVINGN